MRSFRLASVAVAALALVAVSACKDSTSTGLGTVTCASGDAFLCPPNTLDLGYNGNTGTPTITPGSSGTTVTSATSAYVVTGTTTATLPGYWMLVQDGALNTWGVLAISGGTYLAEVPLFCGAQYLILKFTNGAGTSYYMVNVTRSGCTTAHAAFRVQLTWTSDPNSDLDLHLLRPGGSMSTENDCYFGNCTGTGLTWGASNPVLDVDDTDGYGPENINMAAGAEAGEYRIVIHNWDGTVGEVATVKVFINDVERARYTSQALDASTKRYWEVAKVNILTGTISSVLAYSSTAPVTLGAAAPWETATK